MNIETRIAFMASTLSQLAPSLDPKAPLPARTLATKVLAELRAWERLNPCDDPKYLAAEERLRQEDRARAEASAKQQSERIQREGPKLWKELHLRALRRDMRGEAGDDTAYLRALHSKLPCGSCKMNFARHLQEIPPDFANYFEWTVKLHNAVNRELGKAEMLVCDARLTMQAREESDE